MKIYMIRHGQTDWNKDMRLQGQTDIPLNESGRNSADEAGKALSGIRFDLCFCSPLDRAQETAARILLQNENPLPKAAQDLRPAEKQVEKLGISMIPDERIIEYRFGDWEGLICSGEKYELPIPEYSMYWKSLSQDIVIPGAETKENLILRVRSFLNELADRFGDTDMNILVATHGCVFRALRTIADDAERSMVRSAKNCEVIVLEPDPDAEAIQKEHGIFPGDIKFGRKVKIAK